MGIISIAALIGLAFIVYKFFLASPPKPPQVEATPLAKCERCGVWVPEKQTLKVQGKTYCSATCRDQSPV